MKTLTLDSLFDAFAAALAESDALQVLAKETQAGAPFRVFQGFDYAAEKNATATPSIIMLPQSDEEQSDFSRDLSILMELRIRSNAAKPDTVNPAIIKHAAPGIAMRWADAICAALNQRVKNTDAKLLRISVQYDFQTLAQDNLVTVSFVATVPLKKKFSGGYAI